MQFYNIVLSSMAFYFYSVAATETTTTPVKYTTTTSVKYTTTTPIKETTTTPIKVTTTTTPIKSSTTTTPIKYTTTTFKTTTSPTPSGTTPSNGQNFLNKCLNLGISIADCTQLANIAALNGNTIIIGGLTPPGPGSVDNGQQFLNKCTNVGISILDCAQLLNIALLNGNNIDISLAELVDLVKALGLGEGILGGLLTGWGGLVNFPVGLI
ncbi:uncharacterized protein RCC_04288 [Ramularia collo-cygni]|uniref:Hydrophobin n=1 Tax=Ramularia collo-cygni TaxID=112498 RepID=A0A2D3VD30_9PEZI|nr:uncharacterized protein RCC_04288 [Ramularia collo-cygni]CZT18443.1 uncharacterized protein RCC_04288 [Ramularia collo-cygni]